MELGSAEAFAARFQRSASSCHIKVLMSTLQQTECDTLRHTATLYSTLQDTAIHCNTLQHTATHCNTLQHTAADYNTLQHNATHCHTLQHTTTHYNRSLGLGWCWPNTVLIYVWRDIKVLVYL